MSTDTFTLLPENDHNETDGSRYGNYLHLHHRRFLNPDHDPDDDIPTFTTDPALFALNALAIATSPIMSPPYVLHHSHVVDVAVAYGDNHSRPLLRVKLGVPRNIAFGGTLRGMADWERGPRTGYLIEPASATEISAVSMIAITMPLDHLDLPEPRYSDSAVGPDTDTAKTALRVLVDHVNAQLHSILCNIARPGRVS